MAEYQDRFPTGKKCPEIINVIVTASKDSKMLYNITPKGHIIPAHIFDEEFPFDYGVVPQAMGDTSEPLHAIILAHEPAIVKSVAQIKPIALVKIFTGEMQYFYIIGSAVYDPKYKDKTTYKDLPATVKAKLNAWISATERLKYKHIKIEWEDESKAKGAIEHCRRVYAKLAYIV